MHIFNNMYVFIINYNMYFNIHYNNCMYYYIIY